MEWLAFWGLPTNNQLYHLSCPEPTCRVRALSKGCLVSDIYYKLLKKRPIMTDKMYNTNHIGGGEDGSCFYMQKKSTSTSIICGVCSGAPACSGWVRVSTVQVVFSLHLNVMYILYTALVSILLTPKNPQHSKRKPQIDYNFKIVRTMARRWVRVSAVQIVFPCTQIVMYILH